MARREVVVGADQGAARGGEEVAGAIDGLVRPKERVIDDVAREVKVRDF
jgi:hypothetical protein